ncbi:MAG TPA: aldo/keto reductase [Kofleriaceae bacterium]|jgi:aryl-alcohol dehydrogenase-like predicted oxidoreductase|nr:aldo/keto reductase [Kofleriaceae bacterium]
MRLGDLEIGRVGFGAMRITGPGVMGPPPDIEAARATLAALPELGVDFIDTSNAYGPLVSEMMIRQALHPYRGIAVATKGGFLRPGPNQWLIDCRPEQLRGAVDNSLKLLGVERVDLWQLHRIDPKVPVEDQFGTIGELVRSGKIRNAGLSNVEPEHIDAAAKYFTVASVQNRFHVIDRTFEPVLSRCEELGIPFIAYFPLATGALAGAESILTRVANDIGITPGQAALAWLLKRSPSIVVIPGTANPDHLRENVAARDIVLTDEQFAAIGRVGEKAAKLRGTAAAKPT